MIWYAYNVIPQYMVVLYYDRHGTEEERTVAKSLERAQADYDLEMYSSYMDGKAEGKAEGIAEGIAEGEAKGDTERQAKTARLMLREGLQPEIVAKCTELPLESVVAML